MSAAERLDRYGREIFIVPVSLSDKAMLGRFIRVPFHVNAGDPNWVPPLMMERREALSPKKNPLFAHAEAQLFLAVRDGRDVGRISAQIDRLSPLTAEGIGYFGMICAEDDPEIFRTLFAAAEDWLRARGRTRILGPFNLSINEETGLLVDGFDTPPMLMMPHDPPYAMRRVEELGYAKAKDVLAYHYDIRHEFPPAVRKRLEKPLPPGTVLRRLDMSRYKQEIAALTGIFNDAWAGNWGFVPLTEADTDHLAASIRPLIDKNLVWFVEIDGEPAAFMVTLPNLNEAIRDLNGSLLPLGWAKLVWRLKVKGLKTGRVPLMGVKRKYAKGLSGGMLSWLLIDACRRECLKRGMEFFELSWVLEDNVPMRRIAESIIASPYKTYRIYGKTL